jgi:hypothetical protein
MNLGEVFYWQTNKAQGHDQRFKYQLFICDEDWEDGYTFLFISSFDRGGDYRITNPPYTFLTKDESFVTVYSITCYSADELKNIGQPVGVISPEHLQELYQAVLNSDYMEGRHIKRVCNAIKAG